MSLFNTNTTKEYTKPTCIKNFYCDEKKPRINKSFQTKKKKVLKHRIIKDIKNLFEQQQEEDCYRPVRVGNFYSNNYIEYESNGQSENQRMPIN